MDIYGLNASTLAPGNDKNSSIADEHGNADGGVNEENINKLIMVRNENTLSYIDPC